MSPVFLVPGLNLPIQRRPVREGQGQGGTQEDKELDASIVREPGGYVQRVGQVLLTQTSSSNHPSNVLHILLFDLLLLTKLLKFKLNI